MKYISEIHVRKVRNQEFGGEPTPFDDPVRLKFKTDRTGFESLALPILSNTVDFYR
jgi:hypothetical protein